MAITLREVSDDDAARACEIELQAYKGGPLSHVLAPGPFPPDSWQQRIDQLIAMRKDDPSVHFVQAVDEQNGKMIAFAKWHIFETSTAVESSQRPLSFGAGRNEEACMEFFGGMKKKKEELVGNKPHLCMFHHLQHQGHSTNIANSLLFHQRPSSTTYRSRISKARCRRSTSTMGHAASRQARLTDLPRIEHCRPPVLPKARLQRY